MEVNSSIFCFHNLCLQIQSDNSTSTKQEVLRGFLNIYKGDVGLLYKFLLPKYNGRLYHLQDKQLIRLFGAALGVPESTLRTHLQQSGCIATTVQHFFKPRVAPQGSCVLYTGLPEGQGGHPGDHPMKKAFSKLTLVDIDEHLEKLSSNGSELSQLTCIQSFLNVACKHALFAYLRQIKQDLKLGAGVQTVLAGLHPTAGEVFKVCANIQQVVQMVLNPQQGGGVVAGGNNNKMAAGGAAAAAPAIGGAHYTAPAAGGGGIPTGGGGPQMGDINSMISMFTPVRPMLAAPSKGVDHVLSKCPNGAFSETKYDGERIQIHMKKNPNGQRQYAFFARSLKVMKADKYQGLEKYFEEAVAGMESCILDGEILLVDKASSLPLPFGTLGKHKKMQFQSACTCIFIFDLLYVNGHSLLTLPMIKRREEMKKHIRFIQNRVMISEMRIVEGTPQQRQAIMESHLKYAVAEGLEGLVIKDIQSVYEPGSRHWIKLKKDYMAGMADSADLCVLGAYYGSGSKGGILSTFLMGVWDKNVKPGGYHQFKTVCKVGNGHDDLTLTAISNDLLNNGKTIKADTGQGKGFNNPIWIDIHNSIIPDVYIRDPMKDGAIWEISAAEFSATKTHSASGISMRFPRVTRVRNDKDIHTATSLQELEALYQTSQIKGSKLGTLAAQHGGAGGLAAFSASGLSPQHYFPDPNSDDRHERGVMMRVSSAYNYGPGVVKADGTLPVVEGQRFGQIDAQGVHLTSNSAPTTTTSHHNTHQQQHQQQQPSVQQYQQPQAANGYQQPAAAVPAGGVPPGWGWGGGDSSTTPVQPPLPPPTSPPVSAYQTYIQSLPSPPSSKVYVLSTRPGNCNTTLTGQPPADAVERQPSATAKATRPFEYTPGDPSQPLSNANAPHENILIIHPVALRPHLTGSDKEHDHVSHGIQWSKKGTMGGISQFVGDEPQDAYDYYLALSGQPLPPQPEEVIPKRPPHYYEGKPAIGDVLITECSNNRNQGRVFVASVLCQRLVLSHDPMTQVVSTQGVSTDVGAFEHALQHILTPFALQFNCGSLHIAKLSMPYYKAATESWGSVDKLLRSVIIPASGLRCVVYDRKMKAGSAKQHDIPVNRKPFVVTVPIKAGEKKGVQQQAEQQQQQLSMMIPPAIVPTHTSAVAEEEASPASMLLSNPTTAQPLLKAAQLQQHQQQQAGGGGIVVQVGGRSTSVASRTSSLDSPTTRIRRQVHRLSEAHRAVWSLRRNFPLLGHRVVLSQPVVMSSAPPGGPSEDSIAAVRHLICAVVLFGGFVQSKWKVTPGKGGDKRSRDIDQQSSSSSASTTSVFVILEELLATRVSEDVRTSYGVTSDSLLDTAYTPSMLTHFQEAVSSPLNKDIDVNEHSSTAASASSPAATVKRYGGMLLSASVGVRSMNDDQSSVMIIPLLDGSTTAPTTPFGVQLDIGSASAARSVFATPIPTTTTTPPPTPAAFAAALQRVLKLGGVAIPVLCKLDDGCMGGGESTSNADQQQQQPKQVCVLEQLVGLVQSGVLSAMSRALRSRNHRRHRARATRGRHSEADGTAAGSSAVGGGVDSSTETMEATDEDKQQQEETSSVSETEVDESDAATTTTAPSPTPLIQKAAAKVRQAPNKWASEVLGLHALDDVVVVGRDEATRVASSSSVLPVQSTIAPPQTSSPIAKSFLPSSTLYVAHDSSAGLLPPPTTPPPPTTISSPPTTATTTTFTYPSYTALLTGNNGATQPPLVKGPSQQEVVHLYTSMFVAAAAKGGNGVVSISPYQVEGLGVDETKDTLSTLSSIAITLNKIPVLVSVPGGQSLRLQLGSGGGAASSSSTPSTSSSSAATSIPVHLSPLTSPSTAVLRNLLSWEQSALVALKSSSLPSSWPCLVFRPDAFISILTNAMEVGKLEVGDIVAAMCRPPTMFGYTGLMSMPQQQPQQRSEGSGASQASTVVRTEVDAASTDVEQ